MRGGGAGARGRVSPSAGTSRHFISYLTVCGPPSVRYGTEEEEEEGEAQPPAASMVLCGTLRRYRQMAAVLCGSPPEKCASILHILVTFPQVLRE